MFAAEETSEVAEAGAPRASRGIVAVLWQRKALVILGLLLGLIGGALFYWQRPPVYQATAQLLVIKKNPNVLPIANGDPRLAVVEDYMATHLVVLRSPLILDRAIKKKDLMSLKTFENSSDPVGQLLGGLSALRDSKDVVSGPNNILHLTFRGPVPDECGKVLTAVIDSYQEFLDITYRNVSDQTLDLISKARDMLKKDLAESEIKYLKFRQQTSLFWKNKDGVNLHMERVAGLEAKRTALLIRQTELGDRIRFIESVLKQGKDKEALLNLLRHADAKTASMEQALDAELLPLLLQEQLLLENYGEDHPQVQSVRNRIELVRKHFEKSGAGGNGPENNPLQRQLMLLKEDLHETDMTLQSLGKAVDEAKSAAKELSNHEIEEDHLRNDIVRTRLLYEGTIKRLAEINLVRDSGGFDARALSQSPTGVKIAPSALQTIMGGLLLGLLAGIGLAYLADLSDKSFRNPDEVRVRLGLPVLGHVPYLQPDPEVQKKVEAGAAALDPLLTTLYRPKSLDAEAYRAIRTALYFSVQGEGHRVLQVSSPNKGDGKSLLVSNLAISMAQSGKKVLIIDADCRRPRQHKIFNLANTFGLTTVLTQGSAWQEAVHAPAADGLWILPSGPIPPNPSELLSAPAFKELLATLRHEFDYVLVDTPPLLAVTDPCVVAGKVDALVLVLRLTRQGRPHAERAKEILVAHGVNVLGVIINGVSRQTGAGIYGSEHYDYTESYEEADGTDGNDGYYYHDETSAERS